MEEENNESSIGLLAYLEKHPELKGQYQTLTSDKLSEIIGKLFFGDDKPSGNNKTKLNEKS